MSPSEENQVLTYLVTIKTYGHRQTVKAAIGNTLARYLAHTFPSAKVQFISKADVPRAKPYEFTEIPSGTFIAE